MKTKHTVTAKSLQPDEIRKKYGTQQQRINPKRKGKLNQRKFSISDTLQQQNETLQAEIMNVQIKYQKELEKLEKENRDLRQQYLIIKTQRKTGTKKIKVTTH